MKGTVALIHLLFVVSSVQAQFAGGDGSEANPYQIKTIEQLQEIRYQKGKGGYTAFRIPGLVVSNEGTLIAIAEARFATWNRMMRYSDLYPGYSGYSDIQVINDDGDIGILWETGAPFENELRWDGIAFKTIKFSDINNPIIRL